MVCPALPGYGFSGKPKQNGWSVEKIARALEPLMLRLGYQRYYAQGGDWGALVTTAIALQDTEHCHGNPSEYAGGAAGHATMGA